MTPPATIPALYGAGCHPTAADQAAAHPTLTHLTLTHLAANSQTATIPTLVGAGCCPAAADQAARRSIGWHRTCPHRTDLPRSCLPRSCLPRSCSPQTEAPQTGSPQTGSPQTGARPTGSPRNGLGPDGLIRRLVELARSWRSRGEPARSGVVLAPWTPATTGRRPGVGPAATAGRVRRAHSMGGKRRVRPGCPIPLVPRHSPPWARPGCPAWEAAPGRRHLTARIQRSPFRWRRPLGRLRSWSTPGAQTLRLPGRHLAAQAARPCLALRWSGPHRIGRGLSARPPRDPRRSDRRQSVPRRGVRARRDSARRGLAAADLRWRPLRTDP
jgi:hypothetical protein